MLKIEDCKLGTEVIAVKNKDTHIRPALSIGMIYTIKRLARYGFSSSRKRVEEVPNLVLMEMKGTSDSNYPEWGYDLDQFKLRDIKQLESLFRLNEIPLRISREQSETV